MWTGTQGKRPFFKRPSRQNFLKSLKDQNPLRQAFVFFALFFAIYWSLGMGVEAFGLWRGFDVQMLGLWRGEAEILIQILSLGLVALVFLSPDYMAPKSLGFWFKWRTANPEFLWRGLDFLNAGFFKGALIAISVILIASLFFGESLKWPLSFLQATWGQLWSLIGDLILWGFWVVGLEGIRLFVWPRLSKESWLEAGFLLLLFEGFLIWRLVLIPMDANRTLLVLMVVLMWTLLSGMEFFYDQLSSDQFRQYFWLRRVGIKTGFLFFLVNVFGLNVGALRSDSVFFLSSSSVETLTPVQLEMIYKDLGMVGHPAVWIVCALASLWMSWKLLSARARLVG